MGKINGISPREFRKFLELMGCQYVRTKGGHEIWSRKDLTRPIVFQTHINPIPEFIIRNILRLLKISFNEFIDKID
jgi:predicted RNA binding protein YcfA (HicA-like mRNA interferase family)